MWGAWEPDLIWSGSGTDEDVNLDSDPFHSSAVNAHCQHPLTTLHHKGLQPEEPSHTIQGRSQESSK